MTSADKPKGFVSVHVLALILVILVALGGLYILNIYQNGAMYQSNQDVKITEVKDDTFTYTPYATPKPNLLKKVDRADTKNKLAFVFEGEIWIVNPDGTGLKQLTKDEFNKFHINLSPDGKKVAYAFYPRDETKRTNQGYYVGYNSGLAVFNLDTKEQKTLIPYGSIQNHYPSWSRDNRYVSVWVGNGQESKLVDIFSGIEALILKDLTKKSISPIVWVPKSNQVSFIENQSLTVSNVDGSEKRVLATGVDSYRMVHEGPNVPEPPFWSPSGRYVAFYKNSDLYLMDTINNTEVLVVSGKESEMLGRYPEAYPLAFSVDETKLYLYDRTKKKNTVELDIKTGKSREIANFGQEAIISPDKQKLLGAASEGEPKLIIINLSDNTQKECPGYFNYNYYSWAAGTNYGFNSDTWSPDSKSVVGRRDYDEPGLDVFNFEDCSTFKIVKDKNLESSSWSWVPL